MDKYIQQQASTSTWNKKKMKDVQVHETSTTWKMLSTWNKYNMKDVQVHETSTAWKMYKYMKQVQVH